jgi:nucleoside-diphosphate-sugar epimerase
MTVLVTVATGAIGLPRVVHALHQAGCQIRAFSVDAPTEDMFPQSVEVLIGDVTDKTVVKSAMQGVDAVIHLAALLKEKRGQATFYGRVTCQE